MNTRDLILRIIQAGTKSFFDDIATAEDADRREKAVRALREYLLGGRLKETFEMAEPVFQLFLDDCIKTGEFLDPDRWIANRLASMGDLPHSLQQQLFDYALKRLVEYPGGETSRRGGGDEGRGEEGDFTRKM